MKFENVKVGDTVYIRTDVKISYSFSKYFWLPYKVTKVTPKQFVIADGRRFQKDRGTLISGRYYGMAFLLGDDYSETEVVTDQSKEYQDIKEKLEKVTNIKNLLWNFGRNYNKLNTREIFESLTDEKLKHLKEAAELIDNVLKTK